MADATGDGQSEQEIFHLDIHAWIDSQQTAHGVRHDDYAQYHAYCTRRLKRLSHHPDAKKYLICSNKYGPSSSNSTSNNANASSPKKGSSKRNASRHAYCSRQVDTFGKQIKNDEDAAAAEDAQEGEVATAELKVSVPHVNILWYLIVSSERCWAHAHELQKSNTSKRSRVVSKFKRAKQWAEQLCNMVTASQSESSSSSSSSPIVDETTLKECQAYASWMKANCALESYQYETASQEFAKAMSLCHELSQLALEGGNNGTAKEGGEEVANDDNVIAQRLARQDLFVLRADTVIRPLFRYCQYELKQSGKATMEEPRLSMILKNADGDQGNAAAKSNDGDDDEAMFSFRGQDLILDSKELRVLMLKLQSLQTEKNKSADDANNDNDAGVEDETSFLNVLSVLDDALDVVQRLLSSTTSGSNQAQQQSSSATIIGPAIQAKRQNLILWKGYLQFQKTRRVMDHTEAMLLSSSNGDDDEVVGPAEKVHVYESLLQHAKSLLHLPRPGGSMMGDVGEAKQDDGGANYDDDDDEEDEFALQAQANILRLRTFKCYYMALYYFKYGPNQKTKYKSTLALIQQSESLCQRAQEEISACDYETNDDDDDGDDHQEDNILIHGDRYLEELENLPIASVKAAALAALYSDQQKKKKRKNKQGEGQQQQQQQQEEIVTQRPLLLRLPYADSGLVLTEGEGTATNNNSKSTKGGAGGVSSLLPMPIPCKPVFYDLARDYVMEDVAQSITALQSYVDEHTVTTDETKQDDDDEQQQPPKSTSIFSWLTG